MSRSPCPDFSHSGRFFGKLKLAVCTGAQAEFMEIVLDRLKIREKFDVLQTSDGIREGQAGSRDLPENVRPARPRTPAVHRPRGFFERLSRRQKRGLLHDRRALRLFDAGRISAAPTTSPPASPMRRSIFWACSRSVCLLVKAVMSAFREKAGAAGIKRYYEFYRADRTCIIKEGEDGKACRTPGFSEETS